MALPDGLAEIAVTIVAGVLGFMARAITELKARVAVLEHRADSIDRLNDKLDKLDQKLDDLALKFAAQGAPLNRPPTEGRTV